MASGTIYKILMRQINKYFSVDSLIEDFQAWIPGGEMTVAWYADVLTGRLYGLIDAADALGISDMKMQKMKDSVCWAEENIMRAHKAVQDSMNTCKAA